MSEPIQIAAARALLSRRLDLAHAATNPRQYGPSERDDAIATEACRAVMDAYEYLLDLQAEEAMSQKEPTE